MLHVMLLVKDYRGLHDRKLMDEWEEHGKSKVIPYSYDWLSAFWSVVQMSDGDVPPAMWNAL